MNRRPVAFLDVTLIPMEGPERLNHQTVLIRDGEIMNCGDADLVKIPAHAERIDGRGKFLMPGLSDMHTHLLLTANVGEDTIDSFSAEARLELLGFLALGVTTVREMSGTPGRLRSRAARESGELTAPRLIVCSPILEGQKAVWPTSPKVLEVEDVEPSVARIAAEGYDFVKVYHTLSAAVYREIIAASRRHGLRVVGHVPFEVGLEEALRGGQYGIEHLRGYDFDGLTPQELAKDGGRSPERFSSWLRMSDKRRDELVSATVRAAVWNVPTLMVPLMLGDRGRRNAITQHADFSLLPPRCQKSLTGNMFDAIFSLEAKDALLEAYPRQRDFVGHLHRAGANLLIGTDTMPGYLVPGFTAVDEMLEFAAAGISNLDVLRIATVNVQSLMGEEAAKGAIRPGNRLDLILLDADPLLDLQNLWRLDGVCVQGRWRSRSDIMAEIADLRQQLS